MFSSSIPGRVAPTGREPSLPGDKYNRLTLVEEVPGQTAHPSRRRWLCRCDCGTEKVATLFNLKHGSPGSCGCLQVERFAALVMARASAPVKREGLVPGQVFERLTVVSPASDGAHGVRWNVKCLCGAERVVYQRALKSGNTTSCGCRKRDLSVERNKTHGHSKRPEYHAWKQARLRCTNPEDPSWHNYGGRGITMCARWLGSFENFLSDMGERPKGLSLDRIDNDLGYSPSNCRWATDAVQSRNKRSNLLVSYKGRNICLKDAASIAGLGYDRARYVLALGVPPCKALGPEFGEPLPRALESADFSN